MSKLGYQLLAISADRPNQLTATAAELGLTYPLFSDTGLILARALGIVFQAPGKSPLPVPTAYVLDPGGKILFQHIDPDFQQRLESQVILAAAKAFGA